MTSPKCPECGADYVFENEGQWTCLECGHEWEGDAQAVSAAEEDGLIVKDSNGQILLTCPP